MISNRMITNLFPVKTVDLKRWLPSQEDPVTKPSVPNPGIVDGTSLPRKPVSLRRSAAERHSRDPLASQVRDRLLTEPAVALRLGSRGPKVVELQRTLNEHGAKPPLALDGEFGPATSSAVKSFQRARGLEVDGVVGPKTQKALGAPEPTKAAPPPDPTPPVVSGPKAKPEVSGPKAKPEVSGPKQTRPARRPEVVSNSTGAYFRKVETHGPKFSNSTGIHGTGTVPTVQVSTDPKDPRYHTPKPGEGAWTEGPMDRPSVYLGGHFGPSKGGTEVDAGLSYSRVYAGGEPTLTDAPNTKAALDKNHQWIKSGSRYVNVATGAPADPETAKGLVPNFAMRPFSRVTSSSTGYKDTWRTQEKGTDKDVYFYPGERFDMSTRLAVPPETREITFDDKGQEIVNPKDGQGKRRTFQKVVTTVKSLDPDRPNNTSELVAWVPVDDARGPKSFKRVNSIDQFRLAGPADVRANPELKEGYRVGNEKGTVLPTTATATGGAWERVEVESPRGPVALTRENGARVVAGADTSDDYSRTFQIGGENDHGGEIIDVDP
ncbi:MAG: peptidoglycan-binding protein [Deltaproteobacteria bacterium]|nr:peptidoglycan-binding protein [Deltaproteobacteria bacterium]